MHLAGINEPFYFDHFRALEFDFFEVFRRNNDILLRLELVTFDDLLRGQDLAAFLALLIVTNRAVILFMQLIEPDGLFGVHRVVNADRDGYERKTNVTLPYRSHHNSPQ